MKKGQAIAVFVMLSIIILLLGYQVKRTGGAKFLKGKKSNGNAGNGTTTDNGGNPGTNVTIDPSDPDAALYDDDSEGTMTQSIG